MKGELPYDPRGLIQEAYRIEGIGAEECRAIFLDWALERAAAPEVMRAEIGALLERYASHAPDHPMTKVLRDGLAKAEAPKRRGGRSGRAGL